MTCGVCGLEGDAKGCSAPCVAMHLMSEVLEMTEHEAYPGMLMDERAQLQWDFRRRWHQQRGLDFHEAGPKTRAMRQFEQFDALHPEHCKQVMP